MPGWTISSNHGSAIEEAMTREVPMRRLHRVVSALLMLLLACMLVSVNDRSIAKKPAIAEKTDTQMVVKAINSLALDLYPKLKQGDDNLFFSPYSISSALAMTYAGARGETAAQMARTLNFEGDGENLASGFGALNRSLIPSADQGGCRLQVANGLWGHKGFPFLTEYQDLVVKTYQGRLTDLDFERGPEAARKTINKAVEEQTQGKITDLMPAGSISDLTKLVLTNAIYFKGQWADLFRESQTRPDEFTLLDGSKIPIPMMHHTEEYRYAEIDGVQILDLYYKGKEFSMTVFLPQKPAGLVPLEQTLTAARLHDVMGKLQSGSVAVWLPKFTVNTPSYQLGPILVSMGMRDAFGANADFSGIDGHKDLLLQDVFHKAFVNVDEAGTEAAAATAAPIAPKSVRQAQAPPVFRADHPFLFVIRHNPTNCILFMGRLTKP
jgi:serpin B